MKNRHPFTWISESAQKTVFVYIFIFTIIVIVGMQVLGGPLITEEAPGGILSFEFAGDVKTAQVMMESWGDEGQIYAGLNLGFDYLFMMAYASAIGLGCVLVARGLAERGKFLSGLGAYLAWAMFLAALLDAVENYALIKVLLGSMEETWPAVAKYCAGPKFAIVGVGLIYVIVGALVNWWGRRSSI